MAPLMAKEEEAEAAATNSQKKRSELKRKQNS